MNHDQARKDMTNFLKYWLSKTEHNMETRILPSRKQLFSRKVSDILSFIAGAEGNDVYFGVSSRSGNDGSRNGVRECPALWVDLDWKDYPGGREEARERLKAFRFPPTIIINSGHGYHVYWFFKEAELI